MENSNLYINNEGELCYTFTTVPTVHESTMKETFYVKSIFDNAFGTGFNVSLEKDK